MAASLKARREIAKLQSLLNNDKETPLQLAERHFHSKVLSKKGVFRASLVVNSKTRIRNMEIPEPGLSPRGSDDIESLDLPDSIAAIVGELSVDADTGEIQDPQGAEESGLEDATNALVWIIEHESGHMGDEERRHADQARTEIALSAQADPNLLNDPKLYQGRMLELLERIDPSRIQELLDRVSPHSGDRIYRMKGSYAPREGMDLRSALEVLQKAQPESTDAFR